MGFARGFGHGIAGLGMVLARPKLWPLVFWPFVLALFVFAGVFAGVWKLLGVGWALLVPLLGIFLYLPFASLVAAPFNETLAETVEELMTGREPPPFSMKRLLKDLGVTLLHESKKFLRWLLLSGVVLALSLLLPGVGTAIGMIGGAYIAARFAAYDALDATFARWNWSYDQKVAFVRKQRGMCLGLGAVIVLLLMVPVLNAIAMPIGAAAGARLAVSFKPALPRK